ncbi:MAG: hypothetical protein K2K83_00130, partial [Rikenella sp.]|nr:hypothetical protein [Rikenella sp.]
MSRVLTFIAKETQGECFMSFKYCYDQINAPSIAYEDKENSYINLREYAEDEHNPKTRDLYS